jgi:hypothetical protein
MSPGGIILPQSAPAEESMVMWVCDACHDGGEQFCIGHLGPRDCEQCGQLTPQQRLNAVPRREYRERHAR